MFKKPLNSLLFILLFLFSGVLSAQEKSEAEPVINRLDKKEGSANNKAAVKEVTAQDTRQRYLEIRESAKREIRTGDGVVHIYLLAEEMMDEIVSKLVELNVKAISPIAIRPISLTSNLNQQFGDFVEATLVTNIANNTDMVVKRCAACGAMRSRIENGQWVVTLGITSQEDLRREAKRLGVKAFLDIKFSYFPGANVVAMNVEITRADDGAILWTDTYRSDATTASILRSGDRVISRAERMKELERKIDARPYYGHMLYVGAAFIPFDGPEGGIGGASMGYRLYERFGEDRRWTFGIGAEGFANFSDANPLLGSFVGMTLQWEILEPNLNSPTYRTGPTISGFFAGSEGNSVALEWGFDVTLQFRLGLGASIMYFNPVEFAGGDLGGLGYKLRASFNW